MICSGRDDRVGVVEIAGLKPLRHPKPNFKILGLFSSGSFLCGLFSPDLTDEDLLHKAGDRVAYFVRGILH
jgi:hypothetical protein